MESLIYVIPKNIARFRVRYFFGITAESLMAATLGLLLGVKIHLLFGPVLAVLGVLLTWRFESLGDMHLLAFLARWAWARFRPQVYRLMPVHSLRDLRVEILTEDEDVIYVLGDEHL